MARLRPPTVASVPGKADNGIVLPEIAADQLVRLGYTDDFLHAGHFIERAGFDFALIAGDADGGSLSSGNGVCAVSQCFDLFADRADFVGGGVRPHDNQH